MAKLRDATDRIESVGGFRTSDDRIFTGYNAERDAIKHQKTINMQEALSKLRPEGMPNSGENERSFMKVVREKFDGNVQQNMGQFIAALITVYTINPGGTIDKVEYGIGVMWDNGTHNGYSRNDLALYDTPGGICISIWKEG